jgi:hypothetical protein
VHDGWITSKEVMKFFKYTIWLTRLSDQNQDILKLGHNIKSLIKTNGFNFTFLYLKECSRLVVMFLAGTPSKSSYNKGVRVRVNRYGLPVIIPSPLRVHLGLQEDSVLWTKAILTCLNIYRQFPTRVKPDMSSIIEPFSGINKTLVLPKALV